MRHVICFGNELHADDGFGPAVHRRLLDHPWPADVRCFLAGTRGLDALALFADCDSALLVDVSAPAAHPGQLRWQHAADIPTNHDLAPTSPHDAGVDFLLAAIPELYPKTPQIYLLTAEAADITPFRLQLSPPLAAAIPAACRAIRQWSERRQDD